MKFGSRMDVFLPTDGEILVSVGRGWSAAKRSLRDSGVHVLSKRLARRREDRQQRFKRGVYLLPSMFTVANLFCGYGCVVYATQRDFDTAAVLIGIAMVLDTLDGFVARLTKSTSAFGVQLDSLADVVSFGLAPAILAFTWGLWPLKRLGWAAGFIYVTADGHAPGPVQHPDPDRDRQTLLRRHAEPGGGGRHRGNHLPVS